MSQVRQQNFILRRPTPADIEEIREVAHITWDVTYRDSVLEENRARVIASSYSDSSLRQAFRQSRNGRNNWFWVAEAEGQIVGFAEAILRVGVSQDAELTRIYILPRWQRQGVGQALINAILNDIRAVPPDLRPPRLFLAVATSNIKAIRFYESRGFRHNRDFQVNLPGQVLAMQEYVIEV